MVTKIAHFSPLLCPYLVLLQLVPMTFSRSLKYIIDEKTRWVFSLSQGKWILKGKYYHLSGFISTTPKTMNGFDSKLLFPTIQRPLLRFINTAIIWHLLLQLVSHLSLNLWLYGGKYRFYALNLWLNVTVHQYLARSLACAAHQLWGNSDLDSGQIYRGKANRGQINSRQVYSGQLNSFPVSVEV